MRSLKILLIDDDPTVLAVTQALLEDLGHQVVARQGALGSTTAVVDEKPDVVLVDVEMPALRGDRLMGLIRARRGLERTAFILYSGKDSYALEDLARQHGAIGAIRKTGDLDDFVRDFERLMKSV